MKYNFTPNKKQFSSSAADVGLVAGGLTAGTVITSFIIKKNTFITNIIGFIVAWYGSMVVADNDKIAKFLEGLSAYYGVRLVRNLILGDGAGMNGLSGKISDKIPQQVKDVAAKVLPNLGGLNDSAYYDDQPDNYYLPELTAPYPSSYSQPANSPMNGVSPDFNLAGFGNIDDTGAAFA